MNLKNRVLLLQKSYAGYNYRDGPWNYVHGNNSTLSLTTNGSIHPILATTLLKNNAYIPQVRLEDCADTSLVFNNPLDITLRTTIDLFDSNWNKLHSIKESTRPKNTKILNLGAFERSYVKIKSMLLFRPMILKQYVTYLIFFMDRIYFNKIYNITFKQLKI